MTTVPKWLQQQEEDQNTLRSVSVDLNVDLSLQIDIPDALGGRDKVKFTTCTKTTQSTFQSPSFLLQGDVKTLCGYMIFLLKPQTRLIIPPVPTKPDFGGP
ncbi:Sorting nexin-5 [Sciurus carolinensis]|uniref:Sorting nexin-5 n=1 Tax=Sciurus carolinensis TaxID=30640 RepID=A0AA41ST49_SCICA|nr:Sorting nexin-5 [Sciurus carolinensis]